MAIFSARALVLLSLMVPSRGQVSFDQGPSASGLCGAAEDFKYVALNSEVLADVGGGTLRLLDRYSDVANAYTAPLITDGGPIRGVRVSFKPTTTEDLTASYRYYAGVGLATAGSITDLTVPDADGTRDDAAWKKVLFNPMAIAGELWYYEKGTQVIRRTVKQSVGPFSVYEVSLNSKGQFQYLIDNELIYTSSTPVAYPLMFAVTDFDRGNELTAQWMVACPSTTSTTSTTTTPCDTSEPCEDSTEDKNKAVQRLFAEVKERDLVTEHPVALGAIVASLSAAAAGVAIAWRLSSRTTPADTSNEELLSESAQL